MRYKLGSMFGNCLAVLGFLILMGLTVVGAIEGDIPILLAIYGTGLLLVIAFT